MPITIGFLGLVETITTTYHPKNFQFFGSRDACNSLPDTWKELTEPVFNATVDTLRVKSKSEEMVACLMLTIHEMNIGDAVFVSSLSADTMPFLAIQRLVLENWRGETPIIDYYCLNKVESSYHKILNSCEFRELTTRYHMHSGYAKCQCDPECERFRDCCSDYPESPGRLTQNDEVAEHEIKCVSTEFKKRIYPFVGFYLIISCPSQYDNDAVNSKCQYATNDAVDDIFYKLPVTVDGFSYANAFCAYCNGKQVSEQSFWNFGTIEIGDHIECFEKVNTWMNNIFGKSFNCDFSLNFASYPKVDFLHGSSRLGKMCIRSPVMTTAEQPLSLSPEKLEVPAYFLMHKDHVELVDPDCICSHCDGTISSYMTSDMNVIAKLFTDREGYFLFSHYLRHKGHSGLIANIFESFEIPDKDSDSSSSIPVNKVSAMVGASLTGSLSSMVLLALILAHMIKQKSNMSKAKRCQLGIMTGKLTFLAAICGGTAFRKVMILCKFFAITVHFAMLVSFIYMIWYGIQVAQMLWQMNRNMAALSVENRAEKMSCWEIGISIFIWIGALSVVSALVVFDSLAEDSFLRYGENEICLLSGRRGQFYFVVIPTLVMLTANVGSLLVSAVYLKKIWNEPLNKTNVLRLIKFLGKMAIFQSVQFVFGVLYYFSPSDPLKMIFEMLIAYEGLFIALSYFSNQNRTIGCGKAGSR